MTVDVAIGLWFGSCIMQLSDGIHRLQLEFIHVIFWDRYLLFSSVIIV
jgi:hypothetical protein